MIATVNRVFNWFNSVLRAAVTICVTLGNFKITRPYFKELLLKKFPSKYDENVGYCFCINSI